MSDKRVTSVCLDPGLVEWADRYHGVLGYSSRSELLNDLLRTARANNPIHVQNDE